MPRLARILLALLIWLIAYPFAALAESGAPPDSPSLEPERANAPLAPASCPDPRSIPRSLPPADKVILPILMYHHLAHLPAGASVTWRMLTVTPEAFEEQVKYLADNEYHAIDFHDLIAYFEYSVPLPDRPIILTFDDGWIDDYTVAYPVMKKHCMTGTFFPPVNWVDHSDGKKLLTWAMIEEMSREGMEFGSHTLNHHLLTEQSAAQIMQQLAGSKAELEKHTGRPVVALAYPGGGHNPSAVSSVPKAGYGAAVGVSAGVEQKRSDLFLLHRIAITYGDNLKAFEAKLGDRGAVSVSTAKLPPRTQQRHQVSMRWPEPWTKADDR